MLDRFAIETPAAVPDPTDSPVHLRPEWRARRRPRGPCASWTAPAWTVTHRRGRSGRCAAPDVLPLAGSARPHGDDARRDRNGAHAARRRRRRPWLARLADRRPGRLHVVYTTVAWQYFPPKRSPPAPGHLRPRARMRRRTTRSPMSPSRPMAAATVARSLCGSGPMRRSPDPCARRFSRPLGRLARLAIALLPAAASVVPGEMSER
jgi:hypothetical protein